MVVVNYESPWWDDKKSDETLHVEGEYTVNDNMNIVLSKIVSDYQISVLLMISSWLRYDFDGKVIALVVKGNQLKIIPPDLPTMYVGFVDDKMTLICDMASIRTEYLDLFYIRLCEYIARRMK